VQFSLIGYELFVRTDVPVGAGKPVFLEIKLVEKARETEEKIELKIFLS